MTERTLHIARWLHIQRDLYRATGLWATLRYVLVRR
jgi:hypothetical protein